MKHIDLLSLEWPGSERDVNAVAPIILELRNNGFECITGDVFSYLYYLAAYRPKVLLVSNFQGAKINHELCQLAHALDIKVISLIAEGNIRESSIEQMTWGHNKSLKSIYFNKLLLWSERSKKLVDQYYPELVSRTVVVGSVGSDRYKRFSFLTKNEFLQNEFPSKFFKNVIGLAGWGFDRVHETNFFIENKEAILKNSSMEQVLRHRSDFIKLKGFYKKAIEDNPDTAFILRLHPGLTDERYSEFLDLDEYPNIYISRPRECNYALADLISVCDLWGGYESTTCLEAWLLGKETFLVNPSGGEFVRDITAEGSPIITKYSKLSTVINDPEKVDELSMDGIKQKRATIIKDVIGYADGKNYLRASSAVESELLKTAKPSYSFLDVISRLPFLYLTKSILRNINFINRLRGIRLVDNKQIERTISRYQ